MTEAGQLVPDQAIWHDGQIWWMAERNSLGEVTVVDAPEHSEQQVRARVFQPHDEVMLACEARMEAQHRFEDACQRMKRARQSLVFEMEAEKARRASNELAVFDAAGVVAGFELGGDQ